MLNIVICEDNIDQLVLLEHSIVNVLQGSLEYELKFVADSPDLVQEYLRVNDAQVFFLDIDFNNKATGLDLAMEIRKKYHGAYIIFVSEQLKYVFNSFSVHPFDFLPKPVTQNMLKKCLDEILFDYKLKKEDHSKITVKIGSLIKHIRKDEIIYIERLRGKTVIKSADAEIKCYESLEHFENLLCSEGEFTRCHRSFIANKRHICAVDLKVMTLSMSNGENCNIGRSYKKGVKL